MHRMMTHISMSWFKECTERQKTRSLIETLENADLYKTLLNQTTITQE